MGIMMLLVAVGMFRSASFAGIGLAGLGFAGIGSILVSAYMNASANLAAIVMFFVIGIFISHYLSEEQPLIFMLVATLGGIVFLINVHALMNGIGGMEQIYDNLNIINDVL